MKRTELKTWTATFVLFVVASMGASAQTIINYFYMKGEVCAPVTLKTSRGTYVVNYGDRLDGNLTIHSATDANGNAIMDLSADKTSVGTGKATVREYIFSTLYPTKNDSGSDYGGEDYSAPPSSGNAIVDGMGKLADNFQRMTYNSRSVASYPCLALELGLSRMYGEFARLRWCTGGDFGFQLYGGVGKDWVFDGDNKDKLSWHAGLGYYAVGGDDDNQQFDFGVTVSETPVVAGLAMAFDFGYRYFVGRTKRFGFFGGAGFGVGNIKECFNERPQGEKFPGKFVWDVQVGICIKVFAD